MPGGYMGSRSRSGGGGLATTWQGGLHPGREEPAGDGGGSRAAGTQDPAGASGESSGPGLGEGQKPP